MSEEQERAILEEFERRWRSHTPATNPARVLPTYRVPWSEIYTFGSDLLGRPWAISDRLRLEPKVSAVLRRLRREFPRERWVN